MPFAPSSSRPELHLTLSPEGHLMMLLPGANGQREVELRSGTDAKDASALATIERVLRGMWMEQERALGREGAPTSAQAQHWQRHSQFPDPRCVFCRGEQAKRKRMARAAAWVRRGEVQVRRVSAGARPATLQSQKTAEELGL